MIQFDLLGGFRATSGDEREISPLSRKSECLICLLAVSDGMEVTREHAAGLIWSDRLEEQARASLRQEISLLRRNLGKECIEANKRTIRLVPEQVSVDVIQFRDHAAVDRAEALEAAAELYKGPLMAGRDSKSDAFEDWIEGERRSLEFEALGVSVRVAQHHMNSGRFEAALRWAENAVRIDPLREVSQRLVIEALAASGDRVAALKRAAEFGTLLKDELGVEPTDGLLTLTRSLTQTRTVPVRRPATPVPAAAPLSRLFNGRAAVAVMPFRCLSDAPDDIYFADGITEDVVNSLAMWRWFPVIGRYTTNRTGTDVPAMDAIARESGARYVIGGSVRRSSSQYRIIAELFDAGTGQQLWSQRFEGASNDIFAIQDDLSDDIARRVEPEIRRAEARRIYRRKPSELSVWELLQKARFSKFRSGHAYGTKQDNAIALAMFRDALTRDPVSSDAMSGIATCHWHDAVNSWSVDPAGSLQSAMQRAREAVSVDETNYQALATISIIQTFGQHDPATAEGTARKSLDMNPSDILTRHYLVCSLEFGGKFEEALEHCHYMTALDPLAPSLSVLYGDMCTCNMLNGNLKEAIEYGHKCLEADPGYSRGRQRLIAALVAAGETSEAKHEYARLRSDMPTFGLDYIRRTYPFAQETHLDAFCGYFAQLGAP